MSKTRSASVSSVTLQHLTEKFIKEISNAFIGLKVNNVSVYSKEVSCLAWWGDENKFKIVPQKTAEIWIVRQQCQQQECHSFFGLGGSSVWSSVDVLCVSVWYLSRYSRILPQIKDIHILLTQKTECSIVESVSLECSFPV